MLVDWLPAIVMVVLFALGTPIAFAIAISALSFFLISSDRKSTRLNSSHVSESRMPSSA